MSLAVFKIVEVSKREFGKNTNSKIIKRPKLFVDSSKSVFKSSKTRNQYLSNAKVTMIF